MALFFLAFGWVFGLGGEALAGDIVTAARLGIHGTETRFVLELTGKVSYETTVQTGPDRITLSLPALTWQPQKTSGRASSGLVARYAFSAGGGGAQLVLELRNPAKIKNVTFIPPESGHDWRLVVDLAPAGKTEFERMAEARKPAAKSEPQAAAPVPPKPEPKIAAKVEPKPEPKPAPEAKTAAPAPAVQTPKPADPHLTAEAVKTAPPAPGKTAPPPAMKPEPKIAAAAPPPPAPPQSPPKTETLAKAPILPPPPATSSPAAPPPPVSVPHDTALSRPIIVIDAGHGGADPGAMAADGTKEKDVVLNVALALAKKLEKTGRYGVVLTRSADTTLKLHERVDISRAAHGDLFISLHANVFEKSAAVSGLSIYTLSDRASSKAAAELASKENRADLLAGIDLSHENNDVTHILLDLAQHETLGRSVQFAHRLVETVSRTTPLEKNAGQQASLVVLKAPDIPSILVELGYLTNDTDLARLKSDAWIDKFADAFISAADRHFQIKNAQRDDKALLR